MSQEALRAQALVQSLADIEVRFLQGIVAGESGAEIAFRSGVDLVEGDRIRAALFKKLGAKVTADVVRIGILAGL